jgi:hypothetical protein
MVQLAIYIVAFAVCLGALAIVGAPVLTLLVGSMLWVEEKWSALMDSVLPGRVSDANDLHPRGESPETPRPPS